MHNFYAQIYWAYYISQNVKEGIHMLFPFTDQCSLILAQLNTNYK